MLCSEYGSRPLGFRAQSFGFRGSRSRFYTFGLQAKAQSFRRSSRGGGRCTKQLHVSHYTWRAHLNVEAWVTHPPQVLTEPLSWFGKMS